MEFTYLNNNMYCSKEFVYPVQCMDSFQLAREYKWLVANNNETQSTSKPALSSKKIETALFLLNHRLQISTLY